MTTVFDEKHTAKAIHILTTSLYKEPLTAAIRETIANAYDAYKEVGKNPYSMEIKVRSEDNGYVFTVKDYAKGLTKEEIETVYTKFFFSTKEEKEETIGAFGIGAKAPFAISNAITIESRRNGVKTSYVASKLSNKIVLTEIKSESTNEDNGLTVSFFIPDCYNLYTIYDIIEMTCKNLSISPKIVINDSVKRVQPWFGVILHKQYKHPKFGVIDFYLVDEKLFVSYAEVHSGVTTVFTDIHYDFRHAIDHYLLVVYGNFPVSLSRDTIQRLEEIQKFIEENSSDLVKSYKQIKQLYLEERSQKQLSVSSKSTKRKKSKQKKTAKYTILCGDKRIKTNDEDLVRKLRSHPLFKCPYTKKHYSILNGEQEVFRGYTYIIPKSLESIIREILHKDVYVIRDESFFKICNLKHFFSYILDDCIMKSLIKLILCENQEQANFLFHFDEHVRSIVKHKPDFFDKLPDLIKIVQFAKDYNALRDLCVGFGFYHPDYTTIIKERLQDKEAIIKRILDFKTKYEEHFNE